MVFKSERFLIKKCVKANWIYQSVVKGIMLELAIVINAQ
jgi:hypothetical protein